MERKFHILKCRKDRNQIIKLKNKSDMGGTPLSQLDLGKGSNLDVFNLDASLIHFINPCDKIEEGCLPRTGGAHEGQEFFSLDVKRDIVQHGNDLSSPAIGFAQISNFNNRRFFLHSYFSTILTLELFLSLFGGLFTTRSPAFTPSRTSIISPNASPKRICVSTARPPLTT
jgi:hypothetical protein